MLPQPEIYLHDLTEDERKKISETGRRHLARMGLLFVPPALLMAAALVYVNVKAIKLGLDSNENLLGAINVVLVIGVALLLRLFVSHVLTFSKETRAWQKKVVQGKVQGKKGNTVYIGRQTVKLDNAHAPQVNVGDDVEISLSQHAGFILGVVKRGQAS